MKMMSEQRNADKDREDIQSLIVAYQNDSPFLSTVLYLIERAVAAEAEAEKWRIEAFKQNPTQDAYDAACAALEKHRARANTCEAEVYKWREKALQREQRVADLEKALSAIIDKCKGAEAYTDESYAHLYAFQALKGSIESEDRGE